MAKKNWSYVCNLLRSEKKVYRLPVVKNVKSNSSFLSALQTSQVLRISMNAQLTYEPIVLEHFQHNGKLFFLEGFVC